MLFRVLLSSVLRRLPSTTHVHRAAGWPVLTSLCVGGLLQGAMWAGLLADEAPVFRNLRDVSEPPVASEPAEPAEPAAATTGSEGTAAFPAVTPPRLSTEPASPAASRRSSAGVPAAQPRLPLLSMVAEDPVPAAFSAVSVHRSAAVAADATLYDICCVGSRCWAVGERGVLAVSSDAGQTWTTQLLPFECSLRSVCFLTNKLGWVAGTRSLPVGAGRQVAVLLQTRDGGETWSSVVPDAEPSGRSSSAGVSVTAVPVQEIPGFLKIAWFGLEEAMAVSLPVPRAGSATLLRTADGGATWTPVPGDNPQARFTTGAFLSATDGVVGGEQLTYATVVAERAVTIGQPLPTLRQIRGVSADRSGTAWAVGDGAFVLSSRDAGVTWQSVDTGLRLRLDQLFDLQAVAQHGQTIVMGGTPGSCVLRSGDAGRSWQLHPTQAVGELRQLLFVDDQQLLALGSLGTILRSADGGITWSTVRAAEHRAGLLNLTTELQQSPWEVVGAMAGERGIRTVTAQLSPRLTPPQRVSEPDSSRTHQQLTVQQALAQLGANAAVNDWMFPRNRPEHHLSQEQLLAEWNRQTDGEIRRLWPLRLARLIRTWRPTVIVVEPAAAEDAVAQLTCAILPEAIRLAAADQPLAAADLSESGGRRADPLCGLQALFLAPWTVQRVAVRCPPDRTTALAFRASDLLANCGTTSGLLKTEVLQPLGLTREISELRTDRVCYELLPLGTAVAQVTDLVHGLESQLTSAARRAVMRPAETDLRQLQQLVKAAEIESSAFLGHLRSAETEDGLIAELEQTGRRLPAALALQQLRELAALNRAANNVDGYISVLQEIIRRDPQSADARAAAETLFLYYSSAEVRRFRMERMWQHAERSRSAARVQPLGLPGIPGAVSTAASTGSNGAEAGLPGAVPAAGGAPAGPSFVTPVGPQLPGTSPISRASAVGLGNSGVEHTQALLQKWDQQAATAWQLLQAGGREQVSTALLLREAANLRQASRLGEHSALLAEIVARRDRQSLLAAAESQAVHGAATPPIRVINIRKTPKRPWLDAALTDSCWESADEIFLTTDQASSAAASARALVMLSWDDDFLYVAASMEHLANGPQPGELAIDRAHDAAHGSRDRLVLHIDTDRDYATGFDLTIDQTGQTSDRCHLLQEWNPQWYVAVTSDARSWRCEAAIPLQELQLQPTRAGDLWSVCLQRVVPGYLRQTLTTAPLLAAGATGEQPAGTPVSVDAAAGPTVADREGRGFVRFIRTQKK